MKKLLKLAERQHAVFSAAQALSFGVTRDQLRAMVRDGRIERVARNVYRMPGSVRTWRQKLMIAVLAAGPGAAVSGRAAAALWRIPGYREGIVEITQPRRPSRRYKVAREHSSTRLPAAHIRVVDGIPVTSPERTVFDLVRTYGYQRAERLVKTAVARDLTSIADLAQLLVQVARRGRPGVRLFRAVLAELSDGKPPTESELEDLVLAVLAAAGLELPERQVEVGGTTAPIGRVDFLYRHLRLVIEADSRQWHGNWLATEADHRRDALLVAAGFQVIRTNWQQLLTEPELFVNAVRAVFRREAGAVSAPSGA